MIGNTIENLIVAVLIVLSFRTVLDWTVYNLKKPPCHSMLTKREWTIGWVCSSLLIYYILNGCNLLHSL